MPVNVIPAGVFTDPVTRPVDGDPGNGETWRQPIQALTDRTAFLAAQLGGNDGSGGWSYQGGPRTRKIVVPLWSGEHYGGWSKAANPSSNYYWQAGTASSRIIFPIGALIRDAMTLEEVRVLCRVGDLYGTGELEVRVAYANPTFDPGGIATPAPVGVGSFAASVGTGLQVVVFDTGSHAIVRDGDNARDYYVHLVGSDANGLGVDDMDRLHGIELTLGDPGPRNV